MVDALSLRSRWPRALPPPSTFGGKVFLSLGLSCGSAWTVGGFAGLEVRLIVAGWRGWLCHGDVVWNVGVGGVWGLTGEFFGE